MKTVIFFLAFFVITNFVFAQMIYVNAGISVPQGGLANSNGRDFNKPLLVGSGPLFEIGLRHSIKNFGLIGSYRYHQWTSELYKNDPYKSNAIAIGGYYSIKIIDRFFVEPKLMIGYAKIYSPINQYRDGSNQFVVSPASSNTIIKLVGLNFHYDFKNIALFINSDYSFANPIFKYSIGSSSYSVNSLNFSVGIWFKLK